VPIRRIARTGRRGGPETYRCIVVSFPRRGSGASPQNLRPMRMPSRARPRIRVSILSTLPTCIPCRHGMHVGRADRAPCGHLAAVPDTRPHRPAARATGAGRALNRIREGWLNSSQANLRQVRDGSLRRRQTDYVDRYRLHWPERNIPCLATAISIQIALFSLAGARPVVEINQFPGMEIAASRVSSIQESHHDDGQKTPLARWAQRYRRV